MSGTAWDPSLTRIEPVCPASKSLLPSDEEVSRSPRDAALHDPAARFLSRCGKRIRESMVIESYRMSGGRGLAPEKISEAIELLHAGSLIIDDIEDQSVERRGQPTLHLEIGLPLALNTGNWMYFRALETLTAAGLGRRNGYRALTQMIRSIRRCHEGQALDLSTSVHQLDPNQLRPVAQTISALKTGSLTALSAWLGGLAAGSEIQVRAALGRFGMSVGVCLQMLNDLGELHRFADGAERCDDLRNARVTWPWVWGAEVMESENFLELRSELQSAVDDLPRLRCIVRRLIHAIDERAQRETEAKLAGALRSLDDHVHSTVAIRESLRALQRKRGHRCP